LISGWFSANFQHLNLPNVRFAEAFLQPWQQEGFFYAQLALCWLNNELIVVK